MVAFSNLCLNFMALNLLLMRISKVLVTLVLCGVVLLSCDGKQDFLIKKGQVGAISAQTEIQEISALFDGDSIVSRLSEGEVGYLGAMSQDEDQYLIYDYNGNHLLTIVAEDALDSTSLVKRVEVFSPKFQTKDELGIGSNFEDVNVNLQIDRIEKTFTSATLFIDELNATMTIDQTDLGLTSLRPGELSIEQIPSQAKIKSFTIWLN